MDGAQPGGFVGRTDALARVEAALVESLSGRARLVLISGEAGMGKTALLTEATRRISDRGVTTAWGTCWDAERAPGYWPWVQVLREIAHATAGEVDPEMSDADRADLARLVPTLDRGGPTTSGGDLDSDRARFRLFDAVARWLERTARRTPLVVVLDDIQWADDSSLALLQFVVGAHRPLPLLILGAYRHDELRPDSAEVLATIGLRAENIRLHGLSPAEVQHLLTPIGGQELAEQWAPGVHGRTGGHPFLVREISHAMRSQRTPEVLPEAARDLIARRVARLASGCRRILEAAAVAGNKVLPDVLCDVLDLPGEQILSELDSAVGAGVLVADEGGQVRFAHDLYRETIYAGLPLPVRLRLHQGVGTALERRLARGGTVFAGELARHFVAAAAVDGPDRAVRWALEAAADERARLAFAEAAAQLHRARTALDEVGATVASDALVDLMVAEADADARAGRPEQARRLLREARSQALRADDPERLAAVALGLQRLGARFAMPREEVVAVLDEARAAVRGRAPEVEAQITATLARELNHSVPRDRARARPLSAEAVTIARRLDDPQTLAACLLAQHDILWTPGAAETRVDVAREIVTLAEQTGDRERCSEGHLLTANALLESGSPAFRAELDSFLRLEDHLGQPRHDYMALTRRAALALLEGSLEEGERLALEADALGQSIGEPDAGNVRMSQLLEVARARGEPERLRATAAMAVGWWIGVPSHAHAVAAGLLAEAGDLELARAALDTVLDLGTWREDRSYLWSVFVGGLTVAAARLGDRDLSAELLADLTPLATTCGVNGAVVCFVGCHAHWAGMAARTLGRADEARVLLGQALSVHRRLGARAWEAATCVELLELDPDQAGHRERAASLASELGLTGVSARLGIRNGATTTSLPQAVLRHEGDVWHLAHRDRSARLRDAKGLHDLAALLSQPGREISVLELAGSGLRGAESATPVLDARARDEFRRRLADLDDDMAEASANGDLGRVELVETEREALLSELRRFTGQGGRDRGLGSNTLERARKAVTARLRDSIGRIGAVLPDLGAHLDRSIVTGNHCRYQPSEPIVWDVER